uniref:Uncharacterized protein n=1 Tax=Megaselia scalaris TaxID=36166 RepID=T1GT75_MEGSC
MLKTVMTDEKIIQKNKKGSKINYNQSLSTIKKDKNKLTRIDRIYEKKILGGDTLTTTTTTTSEAAALDGNDDMNHF